MKRFFVSTIVAVGLGCGGKVTTPSRPEASAGPAAVAFGTPVKLWTSWEGWCEYSALEQSLFNVHWGPGEGNTSYPCGKVDYDVGVTCDGGCASKAVGEGAFDVFPDRPGVLRAHATLRPKSGRRGKTIHLEPIMVAIPTSAAITCELDGTGAQVDVVLRADQTPLEHDARVRVAGGADCTRNEDVRMTHGDQRRTYSCPVQGRTAELEVYSPGGYTLATAATCGLVFPSPDLGIEVAAGTSARYAFIMKAPFKSCIDDVMRETREAFATWGWQERTTPAPGQTRLVAARNGVELEVELSEGVDADQRRTCRWVLRTDVPAIRGTHEPLDAPAPAS